MIKLKNINNFYYSGNEKFHALKNVNLHIKEGEFIAIMGPSGSGKSTLLKILGLLDKEFEGSYNFKNTDIQKYEDKSITLLRNNEIGFVFQEFNLIKRLTIKENIGLPLIYGGYKTKKINEKVKFLLQKVDLLEKINKFPDELSGGQQQRVAILRALANEPNIIIADEPTGALDSKTSKEIMEYLRELNDEGMTVILITHDINVARKAKRILNIFDGNLVEEEKYEA